MIRVTPPNGPVVSLSDMKAHLRVDHSDEDLLITQLEAATVAYLDGWTGVLGRAILPQVWRQEFCAWGALRLALPDVSAVVVTYLDEADEEQPATTAVLRQAESGPIVDAEGPDATRIFVNMTCGMTPQMLPLAQQIVKLMVEADYDQRGGGGMPEAAYRRIKAIRWNRL